MTEPDIFEYQLSPTPNEDLELGEMHDDMSSNRFLPRVGELTSYDRNQDYGHPYENMKQTADLINALFAHKLKEPFKPHEMALIQIQFKMARLTTSPYKDDNYLDIAGYTRVAYVCMEHQRSTRTPG